MALRFTDVVDEIDLENDCPLVGVHKAEQLSFEDAVHLCAPALGLDDADALAAFIRCAIRKAQRILQGGVADVLVADEIAAINLYTQETPLYRSLNALLRERNRTALLPAFPFLRILLTGLHKLTPAIKTVFRGVKLDLKPAYPATREISWWGFSSCTDSVDVLTNQVFLGDEGKRTMFSITAPVVNIKLYSALQEGEYLLLPGCQLIVKGVLPQGELTIVQLQHNQEQESLLIGFSFSSQPTPQPRPPPTPQPQSFICTWTVSASDLKLTLPLVDDGNYSFEVEWGDKTSSHVTSREQESHTYSRAGTYTVTIVGVIDGFCFASEGDRLKIRNISQWGCLRLGTSRGRWFHGCEHMTCTATDTLDTSAVTNMSQMFCDAHAFNGDMSRWDTSAVTDMSRMFRNAHAFNGGIRVWDTAMKFMFRGAHASRGDISRWNTSAVTNMSQMFDSARAFNRDLTRWDTSAVTNMSQMFSDAHAFNGDLSRWNTSVVTNMSFMFHGARAFNGDLSNWDTSAVTNMSVMFSDAHAFKGDLSKWNTSAVTSMSFMFHGARAFHGDLSSWDTSAVTNMSLMFYCAHAFNGDLSRWDTSAVTSMSNMFCCAHSFNQDLSRWSTSAVTSMSNMFRDAHAFDQDISNWDTSAVTSMLDMFHNAFKFRQDISSWDTSAIR